MDYVDVNFVTEARKWQRARGDVGPGLEIFSLPSFSITEDIDAIDEKEWDRIEEAQGDNTLDKALEDYTHDQNGDPSCTSNAAAAMHEGIQWITYGTKIILSPMSLYNRVGSRRSGSSVNDNYNEMITRGMLPLDTPENKVKFKHTMRHNGYGKCPDGWEETGLLFRFKEAYRVSNSKEFFTALYRGFFVHYGRAGHSILACRAMKRNGKRVAKYKNSWSKDWGENGFGYDSLSLISRGATWAIAARTIHPIPAQYLQV